MFKTWGEWVRFMLTLVIATALIYYAPDMLDKLVLLAQKIIKLFK